jgi:hypothetical protein
MANPGKALQHLGTLLGLFPEGGLVDWKWFDDPERKTLESLLQHRDEIADVIAALLTDSDRDPTLVFSPGLHWEPFPAVAGGLELGLVWSADPAEALQIGIAAKVTQGPAALDIVVWLFELSKNRTFRHLLGNGAISGSLSFTDTFLSSLGAELALAVKQPDPVKGSLTVTASDGTSKTLDSTAPIAVLPWDLVRMGTFIVGSWLRWKALQPGSDEVFKRLAYHLFPMFGGPGAPGAPANPIQPLPPFDEMKTPVNDVELLKWPKSLLQIDGMSVDTEGAQRFLWHGRALLTGDESAGFFDGSVLVQIDPPSGAGPIDGLPPVFTPGGAVPTGQNLKLLGARWEGLPAGKKLEVFHRQTHANNTPPTDSPLLDLNSAWRPKLKGDLRTLASPNLPVSISLDFQVPQPAFAFEIDLTPTLKVKVGCNGTDPTVQVNGKQLDTTGGFIGSAIGLLDALLGDKGKPWLRGVQQILDGQVAAGVQALVVGALGVAGAPEPIVLLDEPLPDGLGHIEITLSLPATAPPTLEVETHFKLGELLDETGIHVGEVAFGFAIVLPLDGKPPEFEDVSFALDDLRLVTDKGVGALLAQFLPHLTKVQGFALELKGGLQQAPFFSIEGGGRIPIQEKLGPLDIRSLLVKVGMKAVAVSVDASFDLSGIVIAPYELGVSYDFKSGLVKPQLNGLGLSMDLNGLTMGGMLAKYGPDDAPDYLGTLQISVFDLFQLAAIGGYSQVAVAPGSDLKAPSLFIFANLDAPLGGPPYFFVTGISGGFGYNRRLPPVFPLQNNPFLKVMRGEIPFDPKKDIRASLEMLGKQFAPTPGVFWVAAGLEFSSCGFINGTLGVKIGANPFQIQISGAAGFGIQNLAYLELEIGTVIDTEKVMTIAGLTHNSYLIHPDLFGLQGQFGLGVWHSGEHAGDFVLSIGGYHPLYTKPGHYPEIERIEVRASLFGFLNLNVSCFFTCTPRELMAGAAVSLWGEFAGIAAGLDVYVDVLIKWDPFKLLARMGVCVWFEFLGRHEVGVDLEIHTPPFGGSATIDLFLVSFTISFGSDDGLDDRLALADFVERQLRLTPQGSSKVTVPTLTSGSTPGLFSVAVGWGRTVEKAQSKETNAQEGLEPGKPIAVQVEFGLAIKSRLPLMKPKRVAGPLVKFEGDLHLPLSKLLDCEGEVTITLKQGGSLVAATSDRSVVRSFPASLYSGEEVEAAQMDGREAMMEKSAAAERVVPGVGDFALEYDAEPVPKDTPLIVTGDGELELEPQYFYPLPIKAPAGVVLPDLVAKVGVRRRAALFRGRTVHKVAVAPPLVPAATPVVREVTVPRVRQARVAGAARPGPAAAIAGLPAGVPLIAVPDSPVRRSELADVSLRIVPRQAKRSRQIAPRQASTGRLIATARRLPAVRPVARDLRQGLHVAPGQAVHVELSRDRAARGTFALVAPAQQVVRSIFLGGYGRPIADVYTTGPTQLAIPAGARRLVMISEEPGIPAGPGTRMGLEGNTLALALEGNTFAAHGCVIEVVSGLETRPVSLTALTGREVLRVARHLAARFGRVAQGAALITVHATATSPAPVAQQVRWRGHDVTLGAIRAVTRGDAVALIVPVAAVGAWSLEVSIGRDYRLDGVVAIGQDAAALATELAASSDWTLLDGRWTPVRQRPGAIVTPVAGVSAGAPLARTLERGVIARVELVR